MQFPLWRHVRADLHANSYQAQLDTLLAAALARRQSVAMSSPDLARRPSLEEWPTIGDGFIWHGSDERSGSRKQPAQRAATTNRKSSMTLRVFVLLVIAGLGFAGMWQKLQ